MLSGQWGRGAIPAVESIPGLYALQAGPAPPNPSELLDSEAMRLRIEQWREQYDFVILDGAPVLPVTDSVTLNSLADATLLTVRNGMTEKPQVKRSYTMLARNGKHPVGVLLNGLRSDDANYYGYYGYYSNTYAYGGHQDV